MTGNHSVHDQDGELFNNESMNQSWQSEGALHGCKAALKNTSNTGHKITVFYLLAMLMMSNILTYILRAYYREIIYFYLCLYKL
jgi:hypothetical protein